MRVEKGYFGEFDLINDTKRRYLCIASKATDLYVISKEDFKTIFTKDDRDIFVTFREIAKDRERKMREAQITLSELLVRMVEEIRIEIEKNPIKKF